MFFFFNDTATTEIYTLSLHDALPIFGRGSKSTLTEESGDSLQGAKVRSQLGVDLLPNDVCERFSKFIGHGVEQRSEEHTSELQSRQYLVCRLLLEKKNTTKTQFN